MASEIVEIDLSGDEPDSLLSTRIDGKLQDLSIPTGNIFKVPKFLRDGNEKAYEPERLAIGPYHRGKHHLSAMEDYKMCYLKQLQARKPENNTRSYVLAMRELEERARACYVDTVDLNSQDFVEMMILDACFIVEIVRSNSDPSSSHSDPLLRGWIRNSISRDLLLVENQLPFFVLQRFFDMTKRSNEVGGNLCNMIFQFFECTVPKPGPVPKDEQEIESKHLLGLLHGSWKGSLSEKDNENPKDKSCVFICSKRDSWATIASGITPKWLHLLCKTKSRNVTEDYYSIRCATELKEAGIQFQKGKSDKLFDIQFKNGKMTIPALSIDDSSESCFRNLIVYEQFSQDPNVSYVIAYIRFMDCLINTSKDVELLCQCGIIINFLGDDDAPANIFNRLCDNITGSGYPYEAIFKQVNHYCHRRWNKWLANLRHNYFNTPWASISFLAALLLLLLTVAQTVFSVLSYRKDDKSSS